MYTAKDHTFIICAYKISEYLEQAVLSVLQQSIKSNVIMVTATPNEHIEAVSAKYDIPLFVNTGEAGIAGDWNFGYGQAQTKIVTICHQDDYYEKQYVELMLKRINASKKPLIAFSDYGELRNGRRIYKSTLLHMKRFMLLPLRIKYLENKIWARRLVLSFGCPICCPTVTFVKENLPKKVFQTGFRSDLDWQAWERLSKRRGSFLYLPEKLMLHRIHEESATTEIIGESLRSKEDYQMFCKFWPKSIAKMLVHFYAKSEGSNQLS